MFKLVIYLFVALYPLKNKKLLEMLFHDNFKNYILKISLLQI